MKRRWTLLAARAIGLLLAWVGLELVAGARLSPTAFQVAIENGLRTAHGRGGCMLAK